MDVACSLCLEFFLSSVPLLLSVCEPVHRRERLFAVATLLEEMSDSLVSCCIRSTLLGGELSGFCFFLHSLKAAAPCRPADGKNRVERRPSHSISPPVLPIVTFHGAASRHVSLSSARTRLLHV